MAVWLGGVWWGLCKTTDVPSETKGVCEGVRVERRGPMERAGRKIRIDRFVFFWRIYSGGEAQADCAADGFVFSRVEDVESWFIVVVHLKENIQAANFKWGLIFSLFACVTCVSPEIMASHFCDFDWTWHTVMLIPIYGNKWQIDRQDDIVTGSFAMVKTVRLPHPTPLHLFKWNIHHGAQKTYILRIFFY